MFSKGHKYYCLFGLIQNEVCCQHSLVYTEADASDEMLANLISPLQLSPS